MTATREFLLSALRRVVDGGDIGNDELFAAIPDPLSLGRAEKDAWEQLSHWADDADIRATDRRYASYKRELMQVQIDALKS